MAKKLRSEQVDLANYYSKTESTPLIQGSNITITETEEGVVISSSGVPASRTHSASDITSGIFNIAGIPTGTSGTTVSLGNHLHTGVYEPVFTKNAAFNKNFGTAAGTVAQGNDSRIVNGQTAFSWGNHSSAGYALNSALTAHINKVDNPHEVTKSQVGLGNVDNTSDEDKPISTAQQTALDDKVDNSQVLTDVPVNAKFTDTVYTHPTTAGNKHIPTGGASGQILRYSASGTAVWGNDNNTTYTAGQGLILTGTVFTPDFGTGVGKVVQGNDTRLSNARTPLAHNQAISTITGLQSALDSKQDTLEPGSNITITDSTISAVDTTYGVATTSVDGLMSSGDKSKLNGIASNANNYSLPTASTTVLGGVKIGSNISISSGVISVAAPYTHPSSHPASMITGLHASATTGVAGSVAWGNVSGKPSTFAPSAHTLGSHSDVTITSIASGEILKWDGTAWINNTLAEAGISASSHSHSWSQITSKPSTFAPSAHTHTSAQISDATNLNTASVIVKRDSSGNFSAGTITASLSGNASTATTATNCSRSVVAGNGLTGGGALSANRTLTLGTPSTLTNATTNAATTDSHTHAITTTTVGAANTIVATDASGGVRGNIIRIGANWTLELSGTELVFKYSGAIKQRMLSDGTILGTGGVTALATN